jgi:hypothetical protein
MGVTRNSDFTDDREFRDIEILSEILHGFYNIERTLKSKIFEDVSEIDLR